MTESTLRDRFEEFIYQCQNVARLRSETIKGYRAAFDLFLRITPDANIGNIQDTKYITNFFATILTRSRKVGRDKFVQGVKKSTTATYHSKLRSFFKWMKQNKHIEQNPFEMIKAPNVEYPDRKFLNREDVHTLFHACGFKIQWDNEFVRRRNLAILAVFLYCGLRKGELLALEVRDFDLERRQLTVRGETSKSKFTRVIPINEEALVTVQDYLSLRKTRDINTRAMWVSQDEDRPLSKDGLKHTVTKLNENSGVKFHVHRLRHTFAVNLMKNGTNLAVIQQLLGHKDVRMTVKYVRAFPADEMRNDVNSITFDSLI